MEVSIRSKNVQFQFPEFRNNVVDFFRSSVSDQCFVIFLFVTLKKLLSNNSNNAHLSSLWKMVLFSLLYVLQHDFITSFVSCIALGDTFSLNCILYDNGTGYFITNRYKMKQLQRVSASSYITSQRKFGGILVHINTQNNLGNCPGVFAFDHLVYTFRGQGQSSLVLKPKSPCCNRTLMK